MLSVVCHIVYYVTEYTQTINHRKTQLNLNLIIIGQLL